VTSRQTVCCVVVACFLPAGSAAQTSMQPRERLSLETAIRLAVANNRIAETAKLEAAKAEEDLAIARSRRFPLFEIGITGSQLLTPASFSFPQGAFGEFPGIGPVPATDTDVTSPVRPTVFFSSQLSQPLSQLHRSASAARLRPSRATSSASGPAGSGTRSSTPSSVSTL
jgi:outer membrane protein TolC